MSWLQTLLFDAGPGMYVVPGDPSVDEIASEVSARGWRLHAVSLSEATDKSSLLGAIGGALGAFDGWGRNWDALVDVWRELDADATHVVLLDDCGTPARRCPDDWATALDIAREHITHAVPGDPMVRLLLRSDDPLSGLCAL